MRTCLLCLLILFATTPVFAQDPAIYVDGTNGADTRTGLAWGAAVRTINKGIQRAQEYNRHQVWVTANEYAECVIISGYYIQLYGGFLGGETSIGQRPAGSKSTIIGNWNDAVPQNNCPAVTITYASLSIVDGFVITHGGGTPMTGFGGGLFIVQSNYVKIWNNSIIDNHAQHGGGIYVQDCADFWLKNNDINTNYGLTQGGGVYAVRTNFGVEYASPQMAKMESNTIENNFGGQRGGGVLLQDNCTGYIWNNTIGPDNIAIKGAGIAFLLNSGPLLHENTITGNGAGERGGGIYCESSNPTILLNNISYNTISQVGRGGGIALHSCSPRIERNRIKGNNCPDAGGGDGGGIALEGSSSLIVNNIIDYNVVKNSGGGLALWDASNPTLTNNTLAYNDAYLFLGGDPPECQGTGGGMALYGSQATLRNNIFWANWAASCINIYCDLTSSVDTDYNDYAGGRTEECTKATADCRWTPGEHDLSGDPDFIDGDYRLGRDSTVIDKGDNSATGIIGSDYPDGDPRKLDGDGNGSVIVDMGADEYWKPIELWSQLKAAADNQPVDLMGYVTAAYPGKLYLEEDSRIFGIRVDKSGHQFGAGQPLRAFGRVKTDTTKERYIAATALEGLGSELTFLKPIAMDHRALGGKTVGLQSGVWSWSSDRNVPPWAEALGLNNIGLLIKAWGKITWVNRDPAHPENEYFYINDGCLRVDGTFHNMPGGGYGTNFGVRVICVDGPLSMLLQENAYVIVTGISSCIKFDTDPVRLIKLRDPMSFLVMPQSP